jgi:hypothetical protein
MGAMMGATVGGCMGALFGTYAVLRYSHHVYVCMLTCFLCSHGHGGAGFLPVVGKMALQSGATFGMFMGIGSVIRSDCVDDSVYLKRREGVYKRVFMSD